MQSDTFSVSFIVVQNHIKVKTEKTMENNFTITIGGNGLPTQQFNGVDYKLYPSEKYFSRS